MQGGDLIKNKIDLSGYINLSKDDNTERIFNELWAIIGKDGAAPFMLMDPHSLIQSILL